MFSKTFHHFNEDQDIEKQRVEAREILGVEKDCLDLEVINAKYKNLAKNHHPDAGGDQEMFKKINRAHKMLKKELRPQAPKTCFVRCCNL